MLVRHVALVAEKSRIKAHELSRVAAALQKQVTRDFAPIWNVSATVDSFARLEDVPVGYWPVVVADNVKGAAGYHDNEDDGQPYALVEFAPDWPLTASHEVLEMLADPYGRHIIAGNSPKPSQGRVSFLVEVCDPSEEAEYGYTVNGIVVSDFYTPDFFEPKKVGSTRYSFTGAITEPRQVLPGGYLSWRDPTTKQWYQLQRFTKVPKFVTLGAKQDSGSLRAWIDRQTNAARSELGLGTSKQQLRAFASVRSASEKATRASASQLRRQIKTLVERHRRVAAARPKG